MTLEEMKQKVYALIEEYNEDAEELTEDEDLIAKMNTTVNSVMFEVSRMKKIPATKTITVEFEEGETEKEMKLTDIDDSIYQLDLIRGLNSTVFGDTIIFEEEGTARVFYYKYPVAITEDTDDSYVFELDSDALECMIYGIAADLLKSDVSQNYGNVYAQRYEQLLQRLDSRKALGGIYLDGGINI